MLVPVKRFIHDPVELVDVACRALLSLHPGLAFDAENRVVYRPFKPSENRVTLLSGGGSGHEPAHAGYVGQGMLDAAVCGAIFASPNVIQIESGLRNIQSPLGSLVIVKNYTGDKLNFGLAVEKSRAKTGNTVKVLMVGDDVSVGRTKGRMVGRRGLAGVILIHKIAGAAATSGASLDDVYEVAEYANSCLATIGVALHGCDVPGQQQLVGLAVDEIELGMGIHNEPGSRKLKPQPEMKSLISEMLAAILDTTDKERNFLPKSPVSHPSEVVLLVNNLGGLSVLELACITGMVVEQLKSEYNIQPRRAYAGTFLSALNGSGFSITLLSLPKDEPATETIADRILAYLDAPTSAIGWSPSLPCTAWSENDTAPKAIYANGFANGVTEKADLDEIPCNGALLASIITSVQQSLVADEPQITAFDTLMGDGDCGTTLVAGITTIANALSTIRTESLSHATVSISELISKGMGGTSGALYAIFFTAFAAGVRSLNTKEPISFPEVVEVASESLATLQRYTKADIGDRTMMDALIPFVHAVSSGAKAGLPAVEALKKAVAAADEGCAATRNMVSVFGRSTYVGAGSEVESETKGIPDPGAMGIVAIARGILNAVQAVEHT
ncbi:dihydroxyacetone kinase [Aaosphaeria arxii CBS 175.79]|uniref:Dihydroxyacetone kinase n=1 Tax=Aaosphaeria arxii CBS 175.79 TaxID=1450172 RepID=A0A6A5XNZ9_9PLEO|nr:dihydroxyacetone kinase [Aaosphaeria arxii CBS 175.79]KAF2014985.1 dihydroxyacetone kinase [Aaosphaeria arxii CBS 175.79]